MTGRIRIRAARLPDDKSAILRFIMGLQLFEQSIEANRRTDADVAEEYYGVITERVMRRNGCILIAENADGDPLGWAASHEAKNEIYVLPEEQTYGYIAELYVEESARGQGIGRALIAKCEEWGRERELKLMMIGALARNARAYRLYTSAGFEHYATELRKYLR